jgi:phage host-nuclease inhibitor protein Gam
MARPKKASVTLASIEECSQAMRKLLLATTDAEMLTAERDAAAAAAMKPFDKRLQVAQEQAKDIEAQLQQYYMSHLAEVETGGARSLKLLYGVMGRRLGNPALKLLNKSWTWDAAREAVRKKWGVGFLIFKDPEIDKEKVKADIPEEKLPDCGLKLHQEERFYAEPDRTAEGAL